MNATHPSSREIAIHADAIQRALRDPDATIQSARAYADAEVRRAERERAERERGS